MEITKELLRKQKFITEVTFTYEFDRIEHIQKKIYDFEEHFKDLFPDEVVDTRVPVHYASGAARFVLGDQKKNRFLEVAQDRAILKFLLTDGHSSSPEVGLKYFEEKCEKVLNSLKGLIDPKFYLFSSSTRLNYSLKDADRDDVFNFYSNRFLNGDNIELPYKMNFSIHYKNGNCLESLNFNDYETFNFDIDLNKIKNPREHQYFRINKKDPRIGLQDRGLLIVINVNNDERENSLEVDETPQQSLQEMAKVTFERVQSMEDFLLCH